MRRSILWLTTVVVLFASSACNKREYCTATGARLYFKGYDTSDISQIKIMGYVADGHFSQPKDSILMNVSDIYYYGMRSDTIYTPIEIPPNEDYRITILPANKTWSISDVQYQLGAYHTVPNDKSWPSKCPLASCLVDNQRLYYPSTDEPGSPSIIVLSK